MRIVKQVNSSPKASTKKSQPPPSAVFARLASNNASATKTSNPKASGVFSRLSGGPADHQQQQHGVFARLSGEKGKQKLSADVKNGISSRLGPRSAQDVPVLHQIVELKNLHWEITQQDLNALASKYQSISATLNYDNAGRSAGTAILEFTDKSVAEKALRALNGMIIKGRPVSAIINQKTTSAPATNRISKADGDWRQQLAHKEKTFTVTF